MKKEQKLNKNQRGFSLVELIIVIAIMAVLVGVLAPAFLRYVEKSRKSADVSAIDSIMSAMEACAIDPSVGMVATDKIVANFASGSITFAATKADDSTITNAVNEMNNICGTPVKLKSSAWSEVATGSLTGVVGTNGDITFTMTTNLASGTDGMLTYAPDLGDKITAKD